MTQPRFESVPGRLPLLGHTVPLIRRRQRFLQEIRSRGDIAEIYLGPRKTYVINSPELLRRVLVNEAGSVRRGRMFDKIRPFIGNGIGTSDGAFHIRQRRLMQAAFHRKRFDSYAALIRQATESMVESWRPGQELAVDEEMNRLTLTIACKTLFSASISAEDAATIYRSFPILMRGAMWRTLLPGDALEKLPTAGNRRFNAARADIRRIIDDIIVAYRADGVDHGDLLSILISARDEDTGAAMTDIEVRDEAITILLAGAESTGHVLTSLFYELSRNSSIEERVLAELDKVLGDRPIEYGDIAELPYTNLVVKETLRMHNPLWLLMRRTKAPVDLDGKILPSDADIVFSPHTMHRDPHLYPNPVKFDPDRWLSDQVVDLPRSAYTPFLIGPHRCIGEFFALMELPIVVATIAAKYRLRLANENPVGEVADLLVHLDKVRMTTVPRS